MADGRYLGKIEKSAISATVWPIIRLPWNLAQWCSSILLTRPTVKIWNFKKSNMVAAAILKNRKIVIISATVWLITTKFGMVTHIDPLKRVDRQNLALKKIQDDGRLPSWNPKNHGISLMIWSIIRILIFCTLCIYHSIALLPRRCTSYRLSSNFASCECTN